MPLFGTDLAPGRYEYNSFTDELLSRQGMIFDYQTSSAQQFQI